MHLDQKSIHRHHPWLGLQMTTSPPIHAGLRQESTETILPQNEKKQQHSPYPCATIKYEATKEYATTELTATPLDAQVKCVIQQLCRKFLYLGRAVNSTLLCLISALASQSSTPTEDTMQYAKQLLDYFQKCRCYWQTNHRLEYSAHQRHEER